MGRFKMGFYLGGILGVGLAWLNLAKEGREKRDELLDHAAVVYSQVKDKVMASKEWKQMTKNQYVVMVQDVVDRYAVETGLAEKLKTLVVKVVTAQWKNIRDEMEKFGAKSE